MSKNIIVIRKETKSWERRVPLVPTDIAELIKEHDIHFLVEGSPEKEEDDYWARIFPDEEYKEAGADIFYDCKEIFKHPIIFSVKEDIYKYLEKEGYTIKDFKKGTTFVFFSHTYKGQTHNMKLLSDLIKNGYTLLDYELIIDDVTSVIPKRTVYFSFFAGIVGMIDTLSYYGHYLASKGIENPFTILKQTNHYLLNCENSLEEIKNDFRKITTHIKKNGIPPEITPFVIGINGLGNTSKGVQHILDDNLPIEKIDWNGREDLLENKDYSNKKIYKVVFYYPYKTKSGKPVITPEEQKEYKEHPNPKADYDGNVEKYFPKLSIFMNCIQWEDKDPKLITNEFLSRLYNEGDRKIFPALGDVTCDPSGTIECSQDTYAEKPVFVYNPTHKKSYDEVKVGKQFVYRVTEKRIYWTDKTLLHGDGDEYRIIEKFVSKNNIEMIKGELVRENEKKTISVPLTDICGRMKEGYEGDGFLVMAVSNLPCELPKESSEEFSHNLKLYMPLIANAEWKGPFKDSGLSDELKASVIVYHGIINPNYRWLNERVPFDKVLKSLKDNADFDYKAYIEKMAGEKVKDIDHLREISNRLMNL